MTNALINFIAKLGSDITLQDPQALVKAAKAAGLPPQQIKALLLKQCQVLSSELDVRRDIVCFMVPAENPKDGEEGQDDKTNEDDATNASTKIA